MNVMAMAEKAPDVLLLAEDGGQESVLVYLAWIMAAALLAPVISSLTRGVIPAVVLLLGLGVAIGPYGAGLAELDGGITMLSELGLGMLFLLAGYEVDFGKIRSRQGGRAALTWLASFLVAGGIAIAILGPDDLDLAVVMALVLTSTALGTLMPILAQQNMHGTRVGDSVLVHGAMGELLPVFAMAILLSTHSTLESALVLMAFFLVGGLVVAVPRTVVKIAPVLGKALKASDTSENQVVVRTVMLVLAILMGVAAAFELDVALGAFAAGVIANQVVPDAYKERFTARLDKIGYGLLIPVFFVVSGMKIDTGAVVDNIWLVLAFVPLVGITRGLPVALHEFLGKTGSGLQGWREKVQLGLYSATALPIIVAVTEVAESSGIIDSSATAVLVAGGAITVLVYPLLAQIAGGKKGSDEAKKEESTP